MTATSFAKAQQIILKTPHLAVIVTDLNLDHGQTGIKLIEQTLKLNDATLAILMSSRLLEAFIFEDKFGFRCAMLEKPINSLEMSKTITSLYDAVSEAQIKSQMALSEQNRLRRAG
ncbi:hypothetical protein OAN307_c00840 [Octadecabacter antarcticus 307]|uniref:Response regulatory domain-containing protein n=1 Tax=Octadecabacter antarcticus 307 TaxID=391626 RepID=M9R271_9RHOB|nr:hypothetical protein [Octadecabacter antarcticus]AGI65858.1 hypothetical protein OAN307_c00840 [Octadecabacter antarcticus 307]